MENTCPDCGEEASATERMSRVRSATCSHCGHAFTVIVDTGDAPPAEGGTEGGPAPAPKLPVLGEMPCEECGEPMAFEIGKGPSIVARCAECETELTFVPGTEEEVVRPPPNRPMGRSFDRRERDGPRDDRGGSPARPCRNCGAPLKFSTEPDGRITGTCDSCGNRFTLPPRREGGFRGRGGPPGRGGGRGYGGRPSWGGGGGRSRPWERGGGGGRSGGWDRGEGGDDRRRRRPRRDEE
jgi:hypothetical protein